MKKILVSAIIMIFFVMAPLVSFSKTAISDGELDAVTAEAGVTLYFGTQATPSMTVTNYSPSVVSYGDGNGFTGYASAGYK